MKNKTNIIIGCLIVLGLVLPVYAQDEEPTPSPVAEEATDSDQGLDNTIKSLKEKIEDKVDEINKESKQVIAGTIESVEAETLELVTDTDSTYTVSLDETITSYFASSADGSEEIEQSDLEQGDYIIVSGPIIEDQISANIIYQQAPYLVLQGQITAIDATAFTVDLVTPEKDEYTLDIEESTSQFILDLGTLQLDSAGFSKYKVGDSIHAVFEEPDEGTSQATAVRTVIIPQEFFVEEAEPTVTPTDDEDTSSDTDTEESTE